MISIKDLKSNDFAYLEGKTEGQILGSVKGAFKYIISLSNMTGTYIDDWDPEVFKSDGKWITDKGEINKAFFARKSLSAVDIPGISPEIAAKLEVPLKGLFAGSVRTYRENAEAARRDIQNYYARIAEKVALLKSNQEKQLLAELAAKTKSGSYVDVVRKILTELPVDLWSVTDDQISFICKTDTIVPNRDKINKINRSYNLGRLIFTINTFDLKIKVTRRDNINRWYKKNYAHFHYGSYFCAGGFAEDLKRADLALDIYAIMETCLRWKDTYDAGSTLTSSNYFNHHPAFTTYESDDFLYGKSELELVKHCFDATMYYCDPMTQANRFCDRFAKQYGFTPRNWGDEYVFSPSGGMAIGQSAEKERPLDSLSKPWVGGMYSASSLPLNYGQHKEWLSLCQGQIWTWSNFCNGDEAPTPDCGVYDPLFADCEDEEKQWLTLDEYSNTFGEYPPGHERDEENEDNT